MMCMVMAIAHQGWKVKVKVKNVCATRVCTVLRDPRITESWL